MALSGLQADSSPTSMWQEHRDIFGQLYLIEGKTLSQVQQIMESQYGFANFPLSIYETRLRDQLGLRKKLKTQNWIAIDQHLTKRGNQQSEVHLNGALIPRKKLKKEIQRDWQRHAGIQVPRDLPLPPGISITTPPQSPCGNTFRNNARTAFENLSATQRLDEPSSSSSSITRRASNISVTTAPISGIDGPNLSVAPFPRYHSIFNKIKEIMAFRNDWFPFTSLETIVFDGRFVKLWHPWLDKLPTLRLQATVLEYLTDQNVFAQSSWSGPTANSLGDCSMRSYEELESIDAAELGLSYAVPTEDVMDCGSDYQVSLNIDLLYAFNLIMYYLANDLGEPKEIYELLRRVAHQVPWHLLEAFMKLDSPTVQESWSTLLDWAFKISSRSFFEALVQILLKRPQLTEWYGTRTLTMAAWIDCYDTCNLLIHHGVSPNEAYEVRSRDANVFPESLKALPMYKCKQYLPLTVAALGGNYHSVKALLDGGADVNLRCDGYTAASYLLFTLEKDNLNRENRLTVMKLLLENGLDVNKPVRDIWSYKGPDCSDETLLDTAYLIGNSELAKLLQIFDKTPESQLTISNIISHAEKGLQELQAYLLAARFPQGLRRQHMQHLALYQSRTKPRAFVTMLQANFDSQLPFSTEASILDRHEIKGSYSSTFSFRDCISNALDHISLISLSRDQISYLWRQDSETKGGLINACLKSRRGDALLHLLENGLCLTEDEGVLMMAEAARQDHFAAVSLLLNHGVNINGTLRVNGIDYSVLSLAISPEHLPNKLHERHGYRRASLEMVEFIVRYGAEINTCYPFLRTFSNHRVDPQALKWLISNGLNLTGQSICNIMLHILGCYHSPEMLQCLINLGLPIFCPDEPLKDYRDFITGEHPLSFFISLEPGQEFISQVLDSGIDVNGTGKSEYDALSTPLQAAINASNLGLVKELISRGAVINETDTGAYTPLELVCGASKSTIDDPVRLSIAEHLLENGADPNHTLSKSNYERSALEFALLSSAPSIRLIELLLHHGADVNAELRKKEEDYSHINRFILHIALTKSHFSGPDKRRVVEMLIDRGASVDARDEGMGLSALEETCCHEGPDQISLVELLLNRGADPNATGVSSPSALQIAYTHENSQLIELLLNRGMDLNRSNVLDRLCRFGSINLLKSLLDRGLDPNSGNALCTAIEAENVELINLLLDRGLDPNSADALALACGTQNIDLIKLLLDRGADPNPRNPEWPGPLAITAAKGALPIALLLLAAGAKVTAHTKYWEEWPLVAAAMNKRLDMVALLLNFETRREAFEEAIWAAKREGHFAVASYIQKHLDRTSPHPPQEQAEEV